MFDVDREITKCKIVVIESLQRGEPHTGKELFDGVLKYKPNFNKEVITEFYNAATSEEFGKVFDKVLAELKPEETILIHVEAHGNENGIKLAAGDFVEWDNFFSLTRPINEQSTHMLILTMSMCKGGIGAFKIEPKIRAPFRAIIGTPRDADASHLLECFTIFFQNYSNMLDAPKAFDIMNNYMINHLEGKSPFWMITAEKQFEAILNPPDDRINILSREHRFLGLQRGIDASEQELKSEIKEILQRNYHEYKRNFLFEDIYNK